MNENYKTGTSIGPEKKDSLSYTERAKARKNIEVICTPDAVISAANATAGFLVGKGNVCRIFGTAADLVGFYPSIPGSVPVATDQNAAALGATVVIMIASDEFIRTTSGVTRVEVIQESANP